MLAYSFNSPICSSSSFVEDPRRPFLRAERDRMVELCRGAGVPIQVEHYFQGEKPSLKMHFEVIKEMRV